MNVENIKRVRDRIASLPDQKFSMDSYFAGRDAEGEVVTLYNPAKTHAQQLEGSCGTCACIAGHALAILDPNGKSGELKDRAAALLGLSRDMSERLFEPHWADDGFAELMIDLGDVTRAQAVRVLDHLISNGKVDWSVAKADHE